jgi:predicted RNA-binding Zn ribbon-like protein
MTVNDTSSSSLPYLLSVVNTILNSIRAENPEEPLCLGFTNTVGSRRSEEPSEYLHSAGKLKEWLIARKLVSQDAAIDESYRTRALELRDALYSVFSCVASGKAPPEDDLDVLNGELCEALAKLDLESGLTWVLAETDERERALMMIALSGAALLTSSERSRVRECADDTCGWLFLDLSKNRSRRWCSMSDCGNLAKARRFQERKRERQA